MQWCIMGADPMLDEGAVLVEERTTGPHLTQTAPLPRCSYTNVRTI